MKIVVTNESGLTDAHLGKLRELGEVAVYTDTNQENVVERLQDADIAVIDCFLTPVNKNLLKQIPSIKFISINSTGFDNVDVDAVKSAGVTVSHVPTFSTGSVAELAIGLMFAAVRKIVEGDKEFRAGLMAVDPGTPEAEKYMGFNLEGKTLGVVGLGDIGTRIAEIGNGIGMNVIAHNRTPKNVPDVAMVDLDELMSKSDVVAVALAVNAETKGIISKERIKMMKNRAVLINIAGMPLIDQDALIDALNNEEIAGAGLDTADETMLNAKNTVLSPHIGYDTHESFENMGRIILGNIQGYVSEKPVNVITN